MARRYLIILSAVFLLFCGILSAVAGQLAPDLRLHSLRSDAVSLGSFKGKKAVLMMFWTTWCPYCREQLMSLNDSYKQFSDQGMEVLAINVGESAEKVEKFVKLRNLSLSMILDSDSSVANYFELMGVPTYVFIDINGYVVTKDNYFAIEKYKPYLVK
ncbi:MAG: TlpA family protein disulfide reductase [Candidatus Omnitrophica bacterium]|jgi:peroxiredoxin|nr:TlpA family protein disulfide reductase [Candidatus Omnitrophota bacterium]